ncbi:MAG: hypothetical protein H6561_11090 [Lewinellaceae bacterium]|nr:hypothetical protein [Lewinellaceae bacterium]
MSGRHRNEGTAKRMGGYNINVNTGISTESIRIEYAIRDHLDERAMHFVPHVWGTCERGTAQQEETE